MFYTTNKTTLVCLRGYNGASSGWNKKGTWKPINYSWQVGTWQLFVSYDYSKSKIWPYNVSFILAWYNTCYTMGCNTVRDKCLHLCSSNILLITSKIHPKYYSNIFFSRFIHVRFCCALDIVSFTHILQGYFTDIGVIFWFAHAPIVPVPAQ